VQNLYEYIPPYPSTTANKKSRPQAPDYKEYHNMTIALYIFAGTCILTMLGWLVQTRNTHLLAVKHDKNTRSRVFIAFLKGWRSELSAFLPPINPFGHGIFQEYQSKLHEFQGQIALLANDFAANKTFERLANRLGSLNQQDMTSQNKPAKDIILEAIDQLIIDVD